MIFFKAFTKLAVTVSVVIIFIFAHFNTAAQMRQLYVDNVADNQIYKISFYSPSEGYVAFRDWIGYTVDSGRTFTRKYVTTGNVNYNGYSVNITFGFYINGVKAFNQNTLIAYGHYGLVPAILYSSDGGSSFTLVYHSQYDLLQLYGHGIKDMVFPENNNIGFAVDADRILKTTDQGLSWSVVKTDPARYFDYLEAADNNNVIALSTDYAANKLYKTSTAGTSWQTVNLPVLPSGKMRYAYFLSANTGWLSMSDSNNKRYLYKTIDGGVNWILQNNTEATPFYYNGIKMKFIDDNTGYIIVGYNIYKTSNSGVLWEPLPRDNVYSYLGYGHNDLFFFSANQLWAGGGHGFLELNTNAGGTTLPKAYFRIDTTGLSSSNIVNLVNFSRASYQFQWFKNNTLISSAYNTSYIHAVNKVSDTIKLVVSNAVNTDTLILYQYFNVPAPPVPSITAFTPTYGQKGSVINISGNNFGGATSVKFGGTPASSFNVVSNINITAVLDTGSTGDVSVTTSYGTATMAGFTSQTPTLTSFSPTSGGTNSAITITGTNFTIGNNRAVKFGGIPAQSFTVYGQNTLVAVVGTGASGYITFESSYGKDSLPGFTYIPPPLMSGFSPMVADQGATVTISGANLIGATNVKFGGIPASSFTVISPTTITAIVAAGASGYVTVVTPRGNDSLPGFTYSSPGLAYFTPAVAGAGTTIEISGSNFTGATAVSFGGTAAASYTVNSPTSISAVVGAGTSGSVTVVSPHGSISKTGFVFSNTPIITSFTPLLGPVGTIVQIHGTNFSPVIANNIVWMGAVQALVSAASASQLTITVPAGATYQPITVTVNGLTCYSSRPFLVTFPGGQLTANTYATKIDFPTRQGPIENIITDLDGDGKPEIIIKCTDTISYFKNNSINGTINFANRTDMVLTGLNETDFKAGDLDGDGKQDIVLVINNKLSALRNTSTVGNISFSSPIDLGATLTYTRDIEIGDMNGDGKPDIIINGSPQILVNTSVGSNISFAAPVNVVSTYSHYPYNLTIADFDGDGRTDIAISNNYNQGNFPLQNTSVTIYRNTFINNSISFAPEINYGPPGIFCDISSGDINGDGKPDLIFGNTGYYTASGNYVTLATSVSVYKNNSTPGNISFESLAFGTGATPDAIVIGNVDGDQKPDIAALSSNETRILKNSSSPNTISFDPPVAYTNGNGTGNGNGAKRITMADLDGDSRPELIIGNYYYNTVSIYKNQEETGLPTNLCANGNINISANLSGTTYQWQVNTGTGFTNISDNAAYSGTTTQTLHLTNIPTAWSGYLYRCKIDAFYSNVFCLHFTNTWTGVVSNAWENPANWSCGTVPDNNTNVIINSGTVVISSNVTINSLNLSPSVNLTVVSGYTLLIAH